MQRANLTLLWSLLSSETEITACKKELQALHVHLHNFIETVSSYLTLFALSVPERARESPLSQPHTVTAEVKIAFQVDVSHQIDENLHLGIFEMH